MSLLKSVPEELKPRECKRIKLCEPPPVPYVPMKDEAQDEVGKLRNLKIKTTIEKDTTLNFQVWRKNGTRKAFLMHVTGVLDAIKKRGHFYNYKKAAKDHEESTKAVESARAALFLLDSTGAKAKKLHKKSKEVKKDATAKVQDSESDAKEAEDAPEADDEMKAGFLGDLEKAKQSQRTAKGAMTVAANKMFAFYLNLLSPESKYTWNKIISEQTESDPYVNLQGDSQEGPRGMSCKLFKDCVMFHLLIAFPINAAEQEKYHITNLLKKLQHINVCQFVRRVEQLNAYIAQMPCFYYSPHANASTKPENVLFTEAELGAHVLHMCPLMWQDQYNLNKKGMTLMDMRLLLTSLEAIEHVCTCKKGKPDNFEKTDKSSNKGEKGKKHPSTNSTVQVPKKVHFEKFEKHCKLCKKHGGAHTMHNTRDCCRFEKDRTEKSSFCAAKKGGKKNYPVNPNFTQLTEKIDKLEKALKKSGKKGKKRRYEDSDSDSE
jgi:hypothetical protein